MRVNRNVSREPWSFRLDSGASYTTNVALVPEGEREDWLYRSGATVNYTPHIRGNLFGSASIGQYLYRYDEYDLLDFDLFSAEAGLFYILPKTRRPDPFCKV